MLSKPTSEGDTRGSTERDRVALHIGRVEFGPILEAIVGVDIQMDVREDFKIGANTEGAESLTVMMLLFGA